ncbi:MAG: hemopexin repeat-containing protein [Candidatus Marithrix sp.]
MNIVAAVNHPKISSRIYFFTDNDKYYRYINGDPQPINPDYYPVSTSSSWSGLPDNFNAAVQHPTDQNYLYFFKNDQYYRYNWEEDEVDLLYPKSISLNWTGVPNNITSALNHPTSSDRTYFFKDDKYYNYAWDLGNAYQHSMDGWPGVPHNPDAAFNHPTDTNISFFIKDNKYYRFNWEKNQVEDKYPLSFNMEQVNSLGFYCDFDDLSLLLNSAAQNITRENIESGMIPLWQEINMSVDLPENHTLVMKGIVLSATAATVALTIAVIIVTAGTGAVLLPVILTIVGGLLTIAGNATWLNWPTDDGKQWDSIKKLFEVSATNYEIAKKHLEGTKSAYNTLTGSVESALELVKKDNLTSSEAAVIRSVTNDLSSLELSLHTSRESLKSLAENQPNEALIVGIRYVVIHSHVLLVMCWLSNECNTFRVDGEENIIEGRDEATRLKSFLTDTREFLLSTFKKAQDLEVAKYSTTISQYIMAGHFDTDYFVCKNNTRVLKVYTQSEANDKMLEMKRTDADRIYNQRKGCCFLFNSVHKIMTELEFITLENPPQKLTEAEIKWTLYNNSN